LPDRAMLGVGEGSPPAQAMVAGVLQRKGVAPPYPFQRPIGSMKSIPASSAMRARRAQSGQLADQRSGTLVAERPDEQLAPNTPIFSAFALYMAMRSRIDAVPATTSFSLARPARLSQPPVP